jgi:hypothetical protein
MVTNNLSMYSIFLTLLDWKAVLENTGKHGLSNDYMVVWWFRALSEFYDRLL